MRLWPFAPLSDMTETLEWSTDILRTKAGEQRIALRDAPRQMFAFSHRLSSEQYSRARALAYENDDMVVPVWAEKTAVGGLSAGATTINLSTAYADYRTRLVVWQSDALNEYASISSVAGGSITLASGLANTYTAALVMPARLCRVMQGLEATREDRYETSASIQFRALDNADLGAEAYPDYAGFPVMTDPAIVSGGLAESVLREIELADNGVGSPAEVELYDRPAQRFSIAWAAHTMEKRWSVRRFLHYLRGSQKAFWLPSWGHDLTLQANIGAGATTITVRRIGYPNAYAVTHIMIRTKAGVNYYREVTGGTLTGGNDVLTIDSALGTAVTTAQVERISFMRLCRLDTDRVEFRHLAGYGADIAAPVVETYE